MKVTKILIVLMISLSMISCNNQFKKVTKLENEIDSVSYALGLNLSAQIKSNFEEINRDIYIQAFMDGLDSTNLLMDAAESQVAMRNFFQKRQQERMKEMQAKQLKEAEAKFADNRKAGEDFLESNKSKAGVLTTASGLQYSVIKKGKGAKPSANTKVKLHYHGTTIDGKVCDSSVDRNQPYELKVNQFVKGFAEGLQLMNVGAKYTFFIPQELAYGAQDKGPMIKPFSALVFEVELLDILSEK